MTSTAATETFEYAINGGKPFKNLPATFAFSRLLVISDALMFSGLNLDGQIEKKPLHVVRHGIRGTQNTVKAENAALIQRVESAKLDPEARYLVVQFSIKMTPLEQGLHSLLSGKREADKELRAALEAFYQGCQDSEAIEKVMYRYARNILNGRWLWRNRAIAAGITITAVSSEGLNVQANALEVPMNHFNDVSDAERELGDALAQGLRGESVAPIQVTAQLDMGFTGPVEVFPSQTFSMAQFPNNESKVSRMLYYVGTPEPFNDRDPRHVEATRRMGQAAIRDAKVGNALRTFDDWYPDFETTKRILAVEPMGANLTEGQLFRDSSASAFSLMKRIHLIDPTSDEGLFMLACLIRGGVYSGESSNEKKATKDKKGKAAKETEAEASDSESAVGETAEVSE